MTQQSLFCVCIYLKILKTFICKDICITDLHRCIYPYIHCSIIHNSQDKETTSVFFDWWLNKEDVAHTYNGILLSHKTGLNVAICSNIDGAWEYHARWNKSGRKGQEQYDFVHVCDIKQKTTKGQTKQSHRHSQQYGGYGGGGEEGRGAEGEEGRLCGDEGD